MKTRNIFLLLMFTLVLFVLAACGEDSPSSAEEVNGEQSEAKAKDATNEEEWPQKLTIGVVHAEDQTTVSECR
ncbi:MAG TPA: hypothetical protein VF095_00665 [Bacillota bacterium]